MADPAGQLGRVDGEDRSDGGDEKSPLGLLAVPGG